MTVYDLRKLLSVMPGSLDSLTVVFEEEGLPRNIDRIEVATVMDGEHVEQLAFIGGTSMPTVKDCDVLVYALGMRRD